MAICAGCGAEVPDASQPEVQRPPCPHCGKKGRRIEESVTSSAVLGDHMDGRTVSDGRTTGYSESPRQGTTSTADIHGDLVLLQLAGVSPQGEQDTMETVTRFVQWLNREGVRWGEPGKSDAPYTDANANGIGENNGATLSMQVVRAITTPTLWHQLSTQGTAFSSMSFVAAAELLWQAVLKKANTINSASRANLVLVLDANRCPGQAFPSVVESFHSLYAARAKELGFAGVYVAGPVEELVASLLD